MPRSKQAGHTKPMFPHPKSALMRIEEAEAKLSSRRVEQSRDDWEEFFTACYREASTAQGLVGDALVSLVVPEKCLYLVRATEAIRGATLASILNVEEIFFSDVSRVYPLVHRIPRSRMTKIKAA